MEIITYHKSIKDKLIAHIDNIYHEFNDLVYLPGFDKDLQDIENIYLNSGGNFWILIDEVGDIIGSIAIKPGEFANSSELKRFYLVPGQRGTFLAGKLFKKAVDHALARGDKLMYLWSDTRFTRSHSFYLKNGFVTKYTRKMNDGAQPYEESYFEKILL